MNPLNVLIDILEPKYRKVVYALVALLALGFSVWQATNGNWTEFVAGLIAALTTTTASVNTVANPLHAAGSIVNPDNGLTYEEADGAEIPDDPTDADSGTPEDTGVYDLGYEGGVSGNEPQPGADEDGFGGDAPEPADQPLVEEPVKPEAPKSNEPWIG